jgi:hypothetical protein
LPNEKQAALDDCARALGQLEAAREHLRHKVKRAVEAGASWADIGEALGVSRQAAWERFGKQ